MMNRLVLIFLSLFFLVVMPLEAAEVRNAVVGQEGSRGRFTYDLLGDESEAEVEIRLTVGGREYRAAELHLEGDFGRVRPGPGKVIWWNVLQDFPRGLDGDVSWSITAGGRSFTEAVTGLEFVFVQGGCYDMGDTFGDGESDERPVHEVCLDDFYLGKYEVTVGQFRAFVKETGYRTEAERGGGCHIWTGTTWEKQRDKSWRSPGFAQDDSHPVVCVSWNDAQAFKDWVSRKSGKRFRLPTEAEWEYAARSGGKREKYAGTSGDPGRYGWYVGNSGKATHPVGGKEPNGLGLYDMSGNVWEWCEDRYGERYYSESPKRNPSGPSGGRTRVMRGGSWFRDPWRGRATTRSRLDPDNRNFNTGFRLSLSRL